MKRSTGAELAEQLLQGKPGLKVLYTSGYSIRVCSRIVAADVSPQDQLCWGRGPGVASVSSKLISE